MDVVIRLPRQERLLGEQEGKRFDAKGEVWLESKKNAAINSMVMNHSKEKFNPALAGFFIRVTTTGPNSPQ